MLAVQAHTTDWIGRATMRLLSRDQGISVWDAVVMATAVAERARGSAIGPEAAVDFAFLNSEQSSTAAADAWPHPQWALDFDRPALSFRGAKADCTRALAPPEITHPPS
jgi:hypothetical protein